MAVDEEQEAPRDAKPGEEDAHEGETPFDYAAHLAWDRRSLRWLIPTTLALATLGAGLGYVVVPAFSPYLSTPSRGPAILYLGTIAVAFIGILTVIGTGMCVATWVEIWRGSGYGPKPAPKPRPLWLALLRLVGYWLWMVPFSAICLLLVGAGIDTVIGGRWAQGAIVLAIGLGFGAVACVLLAGSGVAADADIEPGGKVPEKVRKSRWWRRFRWILALWAIGATGLVIVFGVLGAWDAFWQTAAIATGSWVGVAKASAGEMPEDDFTFNINVS